MGKTVNFNNEIRIRVDNELYSQLKAQAIRRGESMAEVIRRLLKKSVMEETALDASDVINAAVRKAVRSEMKPVEDRMAKLSAKSAIAGATGMYLNYFVIQQALGSKLSKSAREVYDTARVKAVAYLKEPESGDEQ